MWAALILFLQWNMAEGHNRWQDWAWIVFRFIMFDVLWTLWVLRLIQIWWQPKWLNLQLITAERNLSLLNTAILVFVLGGIAIAVVLGLLGILQ